MPVSPYLTQNSYATRPYVRSNSSNYVSPSYTTPKYGEVGSSATLGRTKLTSGDVAGGYGRLKYGIPENEPSSGIYDLSKYSSGATGGYSAGNYLARYKSSDNIPDAGSKGLFGDSKIKKSPSSSSFLSGNTASLLKSLNAPESKPPPTKSRFAVLRKTSPVERKFAGKAGGGTYADHYLAKINKGRDRPREIDTRDINTTQKPKLPTGYKTDANREDGGSISRNRPLVRLTTKREKEKSPESHFKVKEKTIKTIAQRLIEKYTEPEKKDKKPDPYEYVPTRRRFQVETSSAADSSGAPPAAPSPAHGSSISSGVDTSRVPKDEATSPTSPPESREAQQVMENPQSSNREEEEEDIAARLLRATTAAETKKELQSAEEVKDAIIAAVLHPDVDIESDEEMKELVQNEDGSWKKKKKEKKPSLIPKDLSGDEGGKSDDGKGKTIVVQLKRFIERNPSKKRSSTKSSRSASRKSKSSDKEDERSLLSPELVLGKKCSSRDRKSKKKSEREEDDSINKDSLLSLDLLLSRKESEEGNESSKDEGKERSEKEAEAKNDKESVAAEKASTKKPKSKKKVKKATLKEEAVKATSSRGSQGEAPSGPALEKQSVTEKKDSESKEIPETSALSQPGGRQDEEKTLIKPGIEFPEQTLGKAEETEEEKRESSSKVSGIPRWKGGETARKHLEDTREEKEEKEEKEENLKHEEQDEDKESENKISAEKPLDLPLSTETDIVQSQEPVSSPEELPKKRALKRPRQIGPAGLPEKTVGNQFLEARKILKRPGKTAANTVKEEAPQEVPTIKVWKKPVAPLLPQKQGDQFLQARSGLKKPVKAKEDDKEEKKEEKPSEVKPKKLVKKPAAPKEDAEGKGDQQEPRARPLRKQRPSGSRSASTSSDEESTARTKKQEKTKRPLKPRPKPSRSASRSLSRSPSPPRSKDDKSKSQSSLKPDGKTSAKSSKHLGKETEERATKSSTLASSRSKTSDEAQKPEGEEASRTPSAKTTDTPKTSSETLTVGEKASPGKKASGGDRTSTRSGAGTNGSLGKDPKLSAFQSADSGYGSSPSTPQPTPTPVIPDAKDEETCTVCGTNCHKKCERQMPNLCGVNQKLLAEALSSVKKGGSTDGTTRTLPSSTKGSVSGSETETTEEETETDTDSDIFGPPEIRSPLQTRPKFKRYNIKDFNFIKVLGKGSYGKVMLAQQKDTENYFAVKCLKKDVVLEDNDVECTLIERKVLSLGTKHPYLCHLFCTFQTPSHLFFVMEYLTGGDLMFHIQHCGRFDEFRACFYAAEITSGLKFLHGKGIIYRDLKLDNILLDYQGHIRIADFGMCKLQVYLDRYADTFCGTPDYMAPEVIKGQHYNQCVDWWSFGVLLYEMLTGKSPFKGCDEDHLFWLICNEEPFYPKFLSREATSILKQLLDKDSTRRLGIPFSPYGEIKVHPFFKYIDWNKIEVKGVETPYKPRLRHILDVQYFDPLFTKRQAAITPLDESILSTMDQTAFKDFSYTNPNITD
ncbi:serine/threonine-protein kinase PRP4 homolog [Penaeus chinensis]|uniref:serine/threonine-protein kinase PRP4 homolog n=1 Tax=Penaeus chinensis TaxID=139456 RepID=UPI001FB70E35|nr:serine/threonine-protein kinase PRP4 homolog [Penaeus chinensis]